MKVYEIPLENQRTFLYRLLEILPGFLSWNVLLAPIWLSLISPSVAAVAIISYIVIWFIKAMVMNIRVIQGYRRMRQHQKLDWQALADELDRPEESLERGSSLQSRYRWHKNNLTRQLGRTDRLTSRELVQVVIIAFHNETRDILQPTIERLLESKYKMKDVVLVLAYEERGGERIESLARELIADYGDKFRYAFGVKHPTGLPGEIKGKGPNITYAARELQKWLDKQSIDYDRVVVTTLDSDNRPDPHYLQSLAYMYMACPDRRRASFQPLSVYTSNIWDVPAMMRVIATGNTYWNMVLSLRVHMLRNFSAHAQGMGSLVDCDFWSTRTIVEDGHQFWRSYLVYKGDYIVYPMFLPVYQDAVLSDTYLRTFKAQFIQIRRWAWGASDIAYLMYYGLFKKSGVKKFELWSKILRLVDNHVSWATSSLIIGFAAFAPLYINNNGKDDIIANQLPPIISRITTVALVIVLSTMIFSLFKMLPPRPKRYKWYKAITMVFQWVLLPITPIVYSAFSALYSQTRLMFGWYLGVFDATDKAVKK